MICLESGDYCRFGTKWRKRTRFATNTSLQGEVRFCNGLHERWRLRGMYGNSSRTKLAETYPFPLCSILAGACCKMAGWPASSSRLHIVNCAKQSGPCIGQALHLGPGPLLGFVILLWCFVQAMHHGPRPPPGDIILLSFEQVDRIARDTAGTYFSLDHRCVAPAPLAECDCSASKRLRPCSNPDALGVHSKPVPPMNC